MTSPSLLVGIILRVLYAKVDKTLAGVANFSQMPAGRRLGGVNLLSDAIWPAEPGTRGREQ